MNISGILVVTTPPKIDALIDDLNALPGIEVRHVDRDTSKLIVVQEAESIHDEVDGIKKIKKLPGVVLADMVNHYFAEDKNLTIKDLPEDLDEYTGLHESVVPAYLND